MNSKIVKRGIVLAVLTGAVLVPSNEVLAAEKEASQNLPKTEIHNVLSIEYLSKATEKIEQYMEEAKNNYSDMAFAQVEANSYLYVRSEASVDSEWIGKLYNEGAADVVETVGEWTKIESANVSGYVKTEFIITDEAADAKAKEILTAKNPEADITQLDEETIKNSFVYAESKEEEAARLAEEAAANAGNGQAVVDFAMQFVGNPYKWGGTSLTNGADCSGFVKSVYANFGVGMPRTSSAMRNAGVGVSYSEAMPGDVICYQGHVGIYIGNGKIVNAIDDAHGIGVSSATYTNIITVRRFFVISRRRRVDFLVHSPLLFVQKG